MINCICFDCTAAGLGSASKRVNRHTWGQSPSTGVVPADRWTASLSLCRVFAAIRVSRQAGEFEILLPRPAPMQDDTRA